MQHEVHAPQKSGKFRHTLTLWVFGAVALFFLVVEHRAHLYGLLPWLLLAACPLMHLFMHHGHRHGAHSAHREDEP